MESLNILLVYEKYIPVLSEEEQRKLLEERPTLIQLQDWNNRLSSYNKGIEERFNRSYDKIIKQKSKWKIQTLS